MVKLMPLLAAQTAALSIVSAPTWLKPDQALVSTNRVTDIVMEEPTKCAFAHCPMRHMPCRRHLVPDKPAPCLPQGSTILCWAAGPVASPRRDMLRRMVQRWLWLSALGYEVPV